MSDEKNVSLHQKQIKVHSELSDFIDDLLEGDIKQSLLDFIEYCRAIKCRSN
jgi:hypothetical protein